MSLVQWTACGCANFLAKKQEQLLEKGCLLWTKIKPFPACHQNFVSFLLKNVIMAFLL